MAISFPEEYENGISLGTQSQWGLKTAQKWCKGLGLDENKKWADLIINLASLTISIFPMPLPLMPIWMIRIE